MQRQSPSQHRASFTGLLNFLRFLKLNAQRCIYWTGYEHGYCHCRFFQELWGNFVDEDLSPEEKRARALEIEVAHIKRRYGDDWMKYYPYHLDPKYDDENGNPHDYGFGHREDDAPADYWKK